MKMTECYSDRPCIDPYQDLLLLNIGSILKDHTKFSVGFVPKIDVPIINKTEQCYSDPEFRTIRSVDKSLEGDVLAFEIPTNYDAMLRDGVIASDFEDSMDNPGLEIKIAANNWKSGVKDICTDFFAKGYAIDNLTIETSNPPRAYYFMRRSPQN